MSPCLLLLAFAATRAGVTLPDTEKVGDKQLVLNGLGVREATVFNVEVYVAGLYLEAKTGDADAAVAPDKARELVMHFVRDVDKGDLVEAFREGFEKNGAPAALKARIDSFVGTMRDVKKGDRIVMTYVPEQGTDIQIGGKKAATIPGADFERSLYLIFIGPKPPNESLKKGLLGKG